MRFQQTLILLLALAGLGGLVLFTGSGGGEPTRPTLFIYNLPSDDLVSMEFRSRSRVLRLQKDAEGKWQMLEPVQAEADQGRVSGTTLAVAGVVADKVMEEKPQSLARYGLDNPQYQITVSAKDDRAATILIGELNPVANKNYAQRKGYDPVYLIDQSWGEVARGLLDSIPLPATPTPEPTATPTPAPVFRPPAFVTPTTGR